MTKTIHLLKPLYWLIYSHSPVQAFLWKGCLIIMVMLTNALSMSAQIPSGGYAIRPVTHLEVVAGPPGGLLPFRAQDSQLWGYQDTTGRVWIKPVFTNIPSFFYGDFGQVRGNLLPNDSKLKRWEPVTSPTEYAFLNARGDYLRADTGTAVLQQADGSLRLVKRRQCLFQPAIHRFRRLPGTQRVTIDTVWVELRSRKILGTEVLAQDRGGAYWRRKSGPMGASHDDYNQIALITAQGKALTPFQYNRILPFHEGVAIFKRTGFYMGGWGIMNRRGRELTTGVCARLGAMHRNRALLGSSFISDLNQSAIIDSLGQLVRDWQPGILTWAVEGYLVSEGLGNGRNGGVADPYRLLNADGQVMLDGQLFDHVEALLRAGVAAVCNQEGRWGLLGSDLRWRLPCTAEKMRFNGAEKIISPTGQAGNSTRIVQVRREGKWGVVRASDGKQLVPCRYDTLYTPYEKGWLCAGRQGRAYVLKDGCELLEAYMNKYDLLGTEQLPGYRSVRRDHEATVIDSTGQLMCPWTDESIYSPRQPPRYLGNGLTILFNASQRGYGGLNAKGEIVIPFLYSDYKFQDGLLLANVNSSKFSAYDTQGRLLGMAMNPGAKLLKGGWAILDEGRLLVNSRGESYPAPPDTRWRPFYADFGDYMPVPFEYGVMSIIVSGSRLTYITKAGIIL